MARRYKHVTPEIAKKFVRESSVMVDGFLISEGDVFKVRGEYGGKFKFHSFVTNNISGAQWVDCFELISGTPSVFRSFKLDRIKTIPKRGKRRKRVV
jgi:hypothetical protein